MNRSEELVFRLCQRSFLSLWSYANPRRRQGRDELCDILVVCDPHVIILSVKEIEMGSQLASGLAQTRWGRRAVEKSIRQLYGAHRHLDSLSHVITNEGRRALPIPPEARRRVHRIAIALGGERKTALPEGNFGKGFVHVFDEIALDVVMNELDTISDFTKYLGDKEELFASGTHLVVEGGEEEILAYYLMNNRSFPHDYNLFMIDGALWSTFAERAEYRAKQRADAVSYVWDELIEMLVADVSGGGEGRTGTLTDFEEIARVMARENRLHRRLLGEAFWDFIKKSAVRSRAVSAESGVSYVFLAVPQETDRELRIAELKARCLVVREQIPENSIVLGLATETYQPRQGHSFDGILLNLDEWTAEDRHTAQQLKDEFGMFANVASRNVRATEYPAP